MRPTNGRLSSQRDGRYHQLNITFLFGILHPKGTSGVGSVLIALVGISRTYVEEESAAWTRVGLTVAAVTTALAVLTFLIDGAVVKETADRWAATPVMPPIWGPLYSPPTVAEVAARQTGTNTPSAEPS
jgi:hypothetical protein